MGKHANRMSKKLFSLYFTRIVHSEFDSISNGPYKQAAQTFSPAKDGNFVYNSG